ncbi:MAG TPA: SGNH/GDSL hydrolase family protein, partial [Myxococcaceae bacterium]|nr:SGNH/GDSL hydrolase family protein [Myxococcaceae bacterium]
MTAVLIALLLVVGVAAALGLWVSRRAHALPPNAPRRFVAEKQRQPGKQVLACLGDSITHGRASFSWVDLLAERVGPRGAQVINAGLTSDLAYSARQRLPEVIACEPDAVVVLVGTHDVLATTSLEREARYRKTKQLPPVQLTREWYREHLNGIVTDLRQRTRARIALCSLPMLGEKLDSPINQRVREYNEVVREVAREHVLMYLPVHEDLTRFLEKERGAAGRDLGDSGWPLVKTLLQHYLLRMDWNRVADANGYFLCTDGIHLNRRAGERIADLVQAFLLAQGLLEDPVEAAQPPASGERREEPTRG